MCLSDKNFDTVKENVKMLMHVTSIHPSNLVHFSIKPIFNLEEDTRISIPYYHASHISKYIYFESSMVHITGWKKGQRSIII